MNQENEMDGGVRRSGSPAHVRIPRSNRSLRSGVSQSMMNQNSGSGQFQAGPIGMGGHRPMPAPRGPRMGGMFNRFMNRSGGSQSPMGPRFPMRPSGHEGNNGNHYGWQQPHNPHSGAVRPPGHQQFPMPGGGNGPMLGNGNSPRALVNAMMGDLGQGFTQEQFDRMMGGHTPGQENGDFSRAGLNGDPAQALAHFLTQGAAGADGTPGLYNADPAQMDAIRQLMMQAAKANQPQGGNQWGLGGGIPGNGQGFQGGPQMFHPPHPPQAPHPLWGQQGGRGRRGRYPMAPMPLNIP